MISENKILYSIVSVAALAIAGNASAHSPSDCSAGQSTMLKGQAGITISHNLKISGPYSAVVQQTNSASYSSSKEGTYFNALKLTANNFQVQHKSTSSGTPIAVKNNVQLRWIICTH